MGKKRISVVGTEPEAKKAPKGRAKKISESAKKAIRAGKGEGRIVDMGQVALEEAKRIKEKEKKFEKEAQAAAIEATKEVKKKKVRARGKKYLAAKRKIDKSKLYSLKEAVGLVKKTSITRFNGAVELHLTLIETGLSGEISFPHPTGKSQRVAIADEALVKKIQKGKIDFDVLVAAPAMMKKLAPLAKILGPKGLMPNPKTGTISEEPKKLAEELKGKTQYRSEKKAPLVHLVVGKTKDAEKNLVENVQAVFKAIGPTKIQKTVLTSTMGPGVKIDLGS